MPSTNESDGNFSLIPEIGEEDISLPSLEAHLFPEGKPTQTRGMTSTFTPGDLLANRYRINSLISFGGMGEVYDAEDLELQQRIAIKTILPAIARDSKALALLKSEVLLSLQVTHPNVCRIFNLDCHRSSSPEVQPIWFVTMELLRGQTLSHEICKTGRLTLDRALPIAQQMANGLEAARRAKIVHGDFKSGNVILVPSGDGTVRAVITDFGLALTIETANASRAAKVGTPAYMAPEQVTGDELSPQTDVYSFGVVLYEMVTGQWPFNADTPDQIAAKRLTESPTPPVRFVPNLDPAWNRAILKCLAREPLERYASATAAIDDITGRSQIRNRLLAAATALFVAALGTTAFARYKEMGPFRPTPRIAVVGWQNRSGDPNQGWVATELSERLASALRQSTTDVVIPQQEVDRAKTEFSIPTDRSLEEQDLSQFRTALGANALIAGSYNVHNDRLTVDGMLQSAKGKELAHFHEEAPLNNTAEIVSKITKELSNALDSKEVTQQQLESYANIYPKNVEARTLYFEGIDDLRAFNADSAKTKLLQVVALENTSAAAHAALAEAWSLLKYDRQAADEGRQAVELARRQQLAPEILQATEARYAELQLHWSDAAQRYKALHDFFPLQLNYSLRYAADLTKSGQPAKSLEFLDELTKSPKPMGDDPRIQMERAESFAAESNFSEELKAADESLTEASARREKLMRADSALQVCWAQQNTGHFPEALGACESARNIFQAFDDNISAAVAQNGIANIKMLQSDYKGAEVVYQQVLNTTQKANAQTDTAGALLNLAKSEKYLGESTSAESHLRQSIELSKRIEDHGDEAAARIILGSVLQYAGKDGEAREQYETALTIAEQTSDRDTQAYALSNLGQLALESQELALAEGNFRKALALREAMGEAGGIAKMQLRLSDLLLTRKQLDEAQSLAQKASTTAKDLGDMGTFADALCLLGEVELASGDYAASLKNEARAIDLYHSQKDDDDEAQAHLLSARVLLKKGDLVAASAEVAKAQSIPGATPATRQDMAKLSNDMKASR